MTQELQEHLQREMEDALAIEDEHRQRDAIRTVLIHQNAALLDCQCKTSDRVKGMVVNFSEIKGELHNLNDDVGEIKKLVERGKAGFRKIAFEAFKYIIIGGGGIEFLRYLINNLPH